MRRAQVLAILSAHSDELRKLGVGSISVFGSVARDEARDDSDVDVLVELNRPMGLFGFFDIRKYLEELLGRRVDLATPGALHPKLRDRILAEAVRAA